LRTDPEIFIPLENGNPLDEVLTERYENFDIYWYHWPHDGPRWFSLFMREEDYEPVIVIYCNDEVSCVITRPHWEYHYSSVKEEGLEVPPKILFEDEWHPALTKTKVNIREFELKKLDLTPHSYSPNITKSERISQKFRTGLGHNSRIGKPPVQDPADIAQEAYEYYCA